MKTSCALSCDVFETCARERKFKIGAVDVSAGCGMLVGDCPDYSPTDSILDVRDILDDDDIPDGVRLYVTTGNFITGPGC